jgi:O-antigen/teichoic acid export membrane protein
MVSMSMLGKTQTGYYGLGSNIIGMLILIPQVVSRVLYPRINEGVGKSLSKQDIATLVIIPARALTLLLPLLAGILILAAPPLYVHVFPKYLPGLISAQILLFGAFFTCMISNGANYLIAHNRQNVILAYAVVSLAINIAGNIFLINYGLGINGIAISASFSGALLTSLIWKEVFRHMGFNFIEQIKQIVSLYSPFLILLIVGIFLLVFFNNGLRLPLVSCFSTVAFTCLYLLLIATVPPFPKWFKEIYGFLK